MWKPPEVVEGWHKHLSCIKLAEVYSVTECGIQAIFPQNN